MTKTDSYKFENFYLNSNSFSAAGGFLWVTFNYSLKANK